MQVHLYGVGFALKECHSLTFCKSWDCSSGHEVVGAARLLRCQVRWQKSCPIFYRNSVYRRARAGGSSRPRLTDGEHGEQAHGPGSPVPCGLARWRLQASSGNVTERGALDSVPVRPLPGGRGAVMRIRAEPNSGLFWTNDPQTTKARALPRHRFRRPSFAALDDMPKPRPDLMPQYRGP